MSKLKPSEVIVPEYHNSDENTTQDEPYVPQKVDFMSICEISESNQNKISIDTYHIDIMGDLAGAALLTQLRYWFSPSKKGSRKGQKRTRIIKDGLSWVAKQDSDWWDESYVTDKQVRRIKKKLVELGIVRVENWMFDGMRTTHWNLNIQKYTELYHQARVADYCGQTGPAQRDGPVAPKGTDRKRPKGRTHNRSLKQISYSDDLDKHMEKRPPGQDASPSEEDVPSGSKNLSGENDELGHPVFTAPKLKGSALREFEDLSLNQRQSYNLIMNVPPINPQDQRYNQLVAVRVAKSMTFDRIRKGILVYQQRLKRGQKPKEMGRYLTKIFKEGYEPELPHADKNRSYWKSIKDTFSEGSYIEERDGVIFPRVDKEATWRMSQEIFCEQVERAREYLRDT